MKIAICDDFANDIIALQKLISSNAYINENAKVTTFISSSEFFSHIKKHTYDIVFLDIDMPEINGIELGKRINQISPTTFIVFVTSYAQYAIDAFDCEAFHYLLKPINERKAIKVINALIQKYKEKNKYHIIKIKTETKRIPIKDIYYIEYCRRHIIYHLRDREYETVGKFSDVYDELKEFGFLQIHQGYIVNMDKIVDFDRFTIKLEDAKSVVMSTRKRTEVIIEYGKYLGERK